MRRFAALITTLALSMSGLVFSPAYANGVPSNGTYLCTTGEASNLTPNFTITAGLVSAGLPCSGAVVIPAGVTGINGGAFAHSPMTSISIPSSVTSIGASAFRYAALTSITVNINNQNYTSTSDVLFNKASTALIAYPAEKSITSYSIPDTVTSIGDHAFEDANLTSITIPSSVTSFGEAAFENANLTSINIPSSVTSIGFAVFWGCNLTSINIPSSVTSIGSGAFRYSSLASATIPSSVTSIGSVAFADSLSLTSVYFLGSAPATVGVDAFLNTASGAKAYIKPGATGFTTSGTPALWNRLAVEVVADAPAEVPVVANGYRADKLGTVYFAPLSSELSKAAKKKLEAAVIANPSAVYKITGYVQKSKSAKNAKNDADLSLARAKAIETHLASLGAGVTFTVVTDAGLVPAKNGSSDKARRATLYAMTPVVQ